MSLDAVLVDRARILRQAATALKLEGRTQFAEVEPGTWFACRLTLPEPPETYDQARTYKRVVIVPMLLFGTDDDDGNPLAVVHTDMLEVDSDDLGHETWQVTSDPQPLRRREGMIGFQAALRRVEVPNFQPKT